MKRLIPLTGALTMALAVSGVAMAQNGNGHGPGHGDGEGRGGGNERQSPRGGDDARGADHERGNGRGERGGDGNERRAEARGPDAVRETVRERSRDVERDIRRDVDRRVRIDDRVDDRVVLVRRDVNRRFVDGCPPGLAKRDNGCLPPGQARQIERARDQRYDYVWRTLGGGGDYRYRDGYVYRLTPQGGLLGYLPVLGGILSPGNVWPGQYAWEQPPQYYNRYYGLSDRYQYRYADGVLYGVNPQNQNIGQVAALLTGQQFNVGQRLPAGYDVYNVPYAYRNQYADSPQGLYRYNDGYVYRVDPTTQLVQAVIQLLT